MRAAAMHEPGLSVHIQYVQFSQPIVVKFKLSLVEKLLGYVYNFTYSGRSLRPLY